MKGNGYRLQAAVHANGGVNEAQPSKFNRVEEAETIFNYRIIPTTLPTDFGQKHLRVSFLSKTSLPTHHHPPVVAITGPLFFVAWLSIRC